MRRIISILVSFAAAAAAATAQVMPDAPFGWANAISLDKGDAYTVTGGEGGRSVVLRSTGADMRAELIKAVKDYDIIVFDGSCGDFIISSSMSFNSLRDKTFLGVNGAVLRTKFEVTPELRKLLVDAGVKSMSDQGGGGRLSNGAFVAEEREQHTRQAIIDYTGDSKEVYRSSGLFSLNGCENIIFRNIAFVGPGPIDVGGADLLTLSRSTKHVWVDHCSFTDGMDGNFDINSQSDFITVSWCTFQYTDKAFDHKASNLIASSESPSQGVDNLNVTYAYCIWGAGCEVRMPAVRWGTIHLLNNLYDCAGNGSDAVYACIGAEVLLEGNYFCKGVKKIFKAEPNAGPCAFSGNIFKEKFKPADSGSVKIPYAYTSIPASKVPSLVRKGAGPTLKLEVPEATVRFTIHMMGDSTMAEKDISLGNPERGWGMVFENFLDEGVRVINYARNGRSTASAITGGMWEDVKAHMQPGDYLFIQFGHNDEKVDKAGTGAPAWGAYQDNLRLFIKTARESGVTPVLLTPVARRKFVNGKLDPTTHGEWPAAMKAVAKETGTVLIDMEKATIDWISAAGDMASRPYFMWLEPNTVFSAPAGKQDDTHSTPRGARRNCDIVCDSIRAKIPAIAEHLVRYDAVVDKDGRGDYMTVQEAVDAMPDYSGVQSSILIKPGVYRERVIIPSGKRNLRIVGSGAASTVISYDNAALRTYPDRNVQMGTFGSATVYVEADNVTFEDITIENAAGLGEVVGQALALSTAGDCVLYRRCRFIGNQDTIYTRSVYTADGRACRSCFEDCWIEGTTDFIFGNGVAYFTGCTIHSKKNSYITAASTDKGQKYGYVFDGCRFTAGPLADKVYLGRPWRDYANVVYLNCEFGAHIRPEGWHNWSQPAREKTAFYAEYGNSGPGADVSARVPWSHQLSASEAAEYSADKVLGGWNPLQKQ